MMLLLLLRIGIFLFNLVSTEYSQRKRKKKHPGKNLKKLKYTAVKFWQLTDNTVRECFSNCVLGPDRRRQIFKRLKTGTILAPDCCIKLSIGPLDGAFSLYHFLPGKTASGGFQGWLMDHPPETSTFGAKILVPDFFLLYFLPWSTYIHLYVLWKYSTNIWKYSSIQTRNDRGQVTCPLHGEQQSSANDAENWNYLVTSRVWFNLVGPSQPMPGTQSGFLTDVCKVDESLFLEVICEQNAKSIQLLCDPALLALFLLETSLLRKGKQPGRT